MSDIFLDTAIRISDEDARRDTEALLNDGSFEYNFVDENTFMVQSDDADEINEILNESGIEAQIIGETDDV